MDRKEKIENLVNDAKLKAVDEISEYPFVSHCDIEESVSSDGLHLLPEDRKNNIFSYEASLFTTLKDILVKVPVTLNDETRLIDVNFTCEIDASILIAPTDMLRSVLISQISEFEESSSYQVDDIDFESLNLERPLPSAEKHVLSSQVNTYFDNNDICEILKKHSQIDDFISGGIKPIKIDASNVLSEISNA